MSRLGASLAFLVAIPTLGFAVGPKDWPTYNANPEGWRCNRGEDVLSPATVGKLEAKWRFPAKDSPLKIGAVHATPVVVDGCVYFGTVNQPTFYALAPDGSLQWSYPVPKRAVSGLDIDRSAKGKDAEEMAGVLGSALVTDDAVYFADLGGFLFALDRKTGAERWQIDTRADSFPDAHPLNGTFASPILADGKVIFASGAFEQWSAHRPAYRGCNGRGFLVAVEPKSGKIAWKYDVGEKPQLLVPPLVIEDAWGKHTFHCGPSTSTVWSTPSYDVESQSIFFGTDTNNSPRRPTPDNPRFDTKHACACIALDARTGTEKWVTQINPGDVWHRGMRAYEPATGRYLDQSIGDTPKVYSVKAQGAPLKVVGFGCKNGGYYVLRAASGERVANTPLYTGKPAYPLDPTPDPRMLALPGPLGGLQTGCATDGTHVFTNGLDAIRLGTQESEAGSLNPPTAGRAVCISGDAATERWRHERPKAPPAGIGIRLLNKEVGDPIASGVAVANGVVYFTTTVSKKLVVLDAARGTVLMEIEVGAVWSGPSVSRGRVYVGTGAVLFSNPGDFSLFPHQPNGAVVAYGLPGND